MRWPCSTSVLLSRIPDPLQFEQTSLDRRCSMCMRQGFKSAALLAMDQNRFKTFICDGGTAVLRNCVIARNTHTIYGSGPRTSSSFCFFCDSSFTDDGTEECVPTLALQLVEAETCEGSSYPFSNRPEDAVLSLLLAFTEH